MRIPEILDAATAALIENGFVGTTMGDIAARLGLSKPILYRHFESKDVLLEKELYRELTSWFVRTTDAIRTYSRPLRPLMPAVMARSSPDPGKLYRNQMVTGETAGSARRPADGLLRG